MITMDICGGGGPNLTEATAAAGQIASGYVAYGNNGVKITGTLNSEISVSDNISIVNNSSVTVHCAYMSGMNLGGRAALSGLGEKQFAAGNSGKLGSALCTTPSSGSSSTPISSVGYVIISNQSSGAAIAFSSNKTNFVDETSNYFPGRAYYPGVVVARLTEDSVTGGAVITVVDG